MSWTRRGFSQRIAGMALGGSALPRALANAADADEAPTIVDTHQHLWDLSKLRLPWLDDAEKVLRRSYTTADYAEATRGLNVVKAVYMEVDVDPRQHVAEADSLVALCKGRSTPTAAAVIGGEPASPEFASYVKRYRDNPYIRGVRQVLHAPKTKAGYCLRPEFIRGVRLLGEAGLSFDLCMRPGELGDGLRLTELCPDTRFIVDHCGNADPKAFRKGNRLNESTHDVEAWKRDMGRLAGRKNTICKISGIVASAPDGWSPDDLAPIVNHCLDAFGPDRVVFGGDWPVCLLHASYRQWVEALRTIVSSRPAADRRKLWSENALRLYKLSAS